MRMIDADKLEKAMEDAGVLRRDLFEPGIQFQFAWGVPIVDAEPVTRCKDCFWSTRASLTGADLGYDCTLLRLRRLRPDFFCADGEPKQPSETDKFEQASELDKFEQAIQHLRELWSEHCLNPRRETDEL